MANWQDPRPLFPWSAPPDPQSPRTAPKLRPNIFARMARSSVQHPVAVLLLLIFAAATAATISLLSLRVDFARTGLAEASAVERRTSSEFGIRFGEAASMLRIRLSSETPGTAIAAARNLAGVLKSRTDIVRLVIVPELEAADARFAPYYLDTPELNRRVDALRSAQAYLQLLAASPTLGGLNGVLATAKGAADAGSAPLALAPLMNSLAAVAQNLVEGKSASITWNEATGFSAPPVLPEITLLIVPAGDRATLLSQVQQDVAAAVAGAPALRAQVESGGEGTANATPPSSGRQFIVSLFLAVLFLVSLLAIYFRSPRDIVLTIMPVSAGVLGAMALSTFIASPLDAVSSTLPLLLVPGTLVIALCYVLALGRHEKRAISTMSLIMLAAQQSGAATVAMLSVSCVLWAAWLILGPASSPVLAICAIAGHAIAAATTLLALPTFAALVPRQKPEFIPAAAAQAGRSWPYLHSWLAIRPWATFALLLATLMCGLVLVFYQGQSGSGPATRPLQVQAASYQAASERVAALRAEESVGRIVWIDDFLPSDAGAKRKSLSLLAGIALPNSETLGTPANLLEGQYAQVDETLRLLGNAADPGQPLQRSALNLRRSLALLSNASGGPAEAARKFEQALAGGVRGLAPYLASMSALAPPTAADIEPTLRALYLASDGTYRIEVWPRQPVSEREFAVAVRAVDAGAIFAGPDSASVDAAGKWRFAIALLTACAALFALAVAVLARLMAILEFMLVQICSLLLFGGLTQLTGASLSGPVEVASFAGLGASAIAGIWNQLSDKNAWITPWSHLIGPLAGAAVILPLLLLSVAELAGFSRAFLIFIAVIMIVQTVMSPQLRAWLARPWPIGKPKAKPRPVDAVPASRQQLSTKPRTDATSIT